MRILFRRIEGWCLRFDDWLGRRPGPIRATALGVMALLLMAAALPLLLLWGAVIDIGLFVMAWVGEFSFLMRRGDAFAGRTERLIWAVLLIALPPLGLFLFRAHRLLYWPESPPKPAEPANDLA